MQKCTIFRGHGRRRGFVPGNLKTLICMTYVLL